MTKKLTGLVALLIVGAVVIYFIGAENFQILWDAVSGAQQ